MTRARGRFAQGALLVSAGAVPSICGPWLFDPYVLPKLTAAAVLIAAASLASEGPVRTPVDLPLAAFGASAAASWAWSSDRWLGFAGVGVHHVYGLLNLALCAAAFYACAGQGPGFREKLLFWAAAGSIPVSVYGLLQRAGWEPLFPRIAGTLSSSHPPSSLGGSVQLGAYSAMMVPAALYLASGKNKSRLLGAGALVLGLLAVASTFSRAALLAAAGGAWVFLALRHRGWRRAGLAAMTALAAAAAGALAMSRTHDHSLADRIRVGFWRAGTAAFFEHPLLGAGPGGFQGEYDRRKSLAVSAITRGTDSPPDAHNDWVEILSSLGAVGFASWLWLQCGVASAIKGAVPARDAPERAAEEGRSVSAVGGSLAALFLQTKMNVAVWTTTFLGALLAGSLFSGRLGRAPSAAGRWLLLGMSLCVAAAALWLSWADRLAMRGLQARFAGRPREAAEYLERASALNPFETSYRRSLENLLWDVADSTADAASKRLLLRRAWEVAAGGALRRPLDAEAAHLLGVSELRRAQWGGEDRMAFARRAFERSLELNRYSMVGLKDARNAAAMQGDRGRAQELQRDISAIEARYVALNPGAKYDAR